MESKVFAIVLGIMQDDGLPHIGCQCRRCMAANKRIDKADFVACLGIVDARQPASKVWIIDATPDIKYQLNLLADYLGRQPVRPDRFRQPDGIFLTHAHMGHTAGLFQLGPEGMNVSQLTVYGTSAMVRMLQREQIWRPMVENLNLETIHPGETVTLAPELTITGYSVSHRDEVGAGTLAYVCGGPSRSILYLPDIDNWSSFAEVKQVLTGVDSCLVDGTFFSSDELGDRRDVPHPTAIETIEYWSGWSGQIWLTHINHTNPLLDQDGEARQIVNQAGIGVAYTRQIFPL